MKMPSGRSSFALWSMMVKKMENNVGARMHPCLMPLEMGKVVRQRPIVLHLTFMELAEDGKKFDFPKLDLPIKY